jgi:predicted house-cleaning noncanonical NTP pyrophosphatase (MazG superfamily)
MSVRQSFPGRHEPLQEFCQALLPSEQPGASKTVLSPQPDSNLEEYMNVRQKKQEMLAAMHRARALEPSSFVPNKLLDTLIEKLHLKNDAELCRVLEVQPPIISKIRHRKLNVGATILLRMHEKSNIPIRELKELTSAALH